MIFKFIKYVRPVWQFNLSYQLNKKFSSSIPAEKSDYDLLPDENYEAESARIADLGYRLVNTGYLIEANHTEIEKVMNLPPPTLKDEYRFIRKFYGKQWAIYILCRRLMAFANPFSEIKAFYETGKIKQVDLFAEYNEWKDYDLYNSILIESNPLVCVVIPTLNRYNYLKNVLRDLENQSYQNFEVIVIDQSDNFDRDFYKDYHLNIRVIYQKTRALWTARNKAVALSKADYLLFFDDDSIVRPDWIFHHLKCLDFFKVDVSAGVSFTATGGKVSKSYNFFRWADQFDSGNAMVKRNVFEKTGLFDLSFNGMRMGDGEFSFRLYKNGIKSISNSKASRIHLKAPEGGLRELGSWDGFRSKKFFGPKPIPSVIYFYKKYLPAAYYKNAILLGILLSNVSFRSKSKRGMLLLSLFISVIKFPILFIQYKISKSVADKMQENIPALPKTILQPNRVIE